MKRAVVVLQFDPEEHGGFDAVVARLGTVMQESVTVFAAIDEPAAHVIQLVRDLERGRFTPAEPST